MKRNHIKILVATAVLASVLGTSAAVAKTARLSGAGIDAFYVDLHKPSKSGTSAKGKANVFEYCSSHSTYVRYCNWHTTVERSSWRGYQTIPGSKISNRKGWQYPKGTMLKGSYDYKTHFHGSAHVRGSCHSGISGGGKKWPITSRVCWLSGTWTADSYKRRLTR